MTTFAALVDKLIEASSYANLVHVIAPNDEGGPRELAAARQAIFTAFDVAVRTADADGYARATAEVNAACERLHDHNGGSIELHRCWMAGRGRDEDGWYAVGQPPNPRGVFPRDTPTDAIRAAADNMPTATASATGPDVRP